MNFTAIINWILWRLAPAAWLEGVIGRLIAWALALLENEDERAWLDDSQKNAHWFGGWLTVIEARLDELIDLRAHQLLNLHWRPRDVPRHYPAPSVRSFDDCLIRLARLIQRFEDVDRLALRRAERLQRFARELEANPLGLADRRLILVSRSAANAHAASRRTADSTNSTDAAATVVSSSISSIENAARARYYATPIRAPPWLGPTSKTKANPNPQASPARSQTHAPITDRLPSAHGSAHRALMHAALASHHPRRQLPPASKHATLRGRDS